MSRLIIGLTGFAEHGKDTVADHLAAKHGFARDAFVDDVRNAALILDPWISYQVEERSDIRGFARLSTIVEEIGWTRAKKEHPEVRTLLQCVGSDIGWQMHGRDIWVNRVAGRIGDADVAISDVRLEHEIDWIASVGGVSIRVDRPGHQGTSGANSTHISETQILELPVDRVLVNDGSLEQLYDKVDALLAQLR